MSEPIIIRRPQPDAEERLVLVPPGGRTISELRAAYNRAAGRHMSGSAHTRGVVAIARMLYGRDATPADLARGGWVPLAALVGPLDLLSPPTLEGALEAIRAGQADGAAWAGKAGSWQARAEKAERERDDLLEGDTREARTQRERADAVEAERDTLRARLDAVRLALDPHSHESKRDLVDMAHDTVRAVRDEGLRAARFEAERDDLLARIDTALRTPSRRAWSNQAEHESRTIRAPVAEPRITPGSANHLERCLVAQAVAANVDIRVAEDDVGFMVGAHAPGCDEELCRNVPAADVPATLARLAGLEVSRG